MSDYEKTKADLDYVLEEDGHSSAAVEKLLGLDDYIDRQQHRIRDLEALVESAYREGFIDGYDDDAHPQDAGSGWEHSDVRKQLEPSR